MKQIVGSTLRDSKEADTSLVTNFESDKSAAEYAKLYRDDDLVGGHVIMLGADTLSISAAIEALHAYPGRASVLLFFYGCFQFLASLVKYEQPQILLLPKPPYLLLIIPLV